MENKTPRLLKQYREEIIPKLQEKLGYKNRLEVPRLVKIVVNMGVGKAADDAKIADKASEEMAIITGQRPVITRAKKAISNFKLRKGSPVGCKVTLRRRNMYEFFDRLINVAIPRIRDFRGLNANSFDNYGNYNLGLQEQHIFPEIDFDNIERVQGMDITIETTAKTNQEAFELLKFFGVPFRNEPKKSNK